MNTLSMLLNFINSKKNCINNPKNETEKIVKHSKSGYLRITKVSTNIGYLMNGETFEGYAPMFATGIAVYIIQPNNYFHTSVIVDIDWEKHIIQTYNSEYSFEFREIEDLDKLLEEYKNEDLRTK